MHEVRNVIAFKDHSEVDAEGNAKYPLPKEGQSIPDPEEPHDKKAHVWEPGTYLWYSKSHWAAVEKMMDMSRSLPDQKRQVEKLDSRRKLWKEYVEHSRKLGAESKAPVQPPSESVPSNRFWSWTPPTNPGPDPSYALLYCCSIPRF
jgi:hypothetical protein